VEKLSEGCREDLMHSLDRTLLIDGEQVLRDEEARILCKDGGNMREIHENAEGVKKEKRVEE